MSERTIELVTGPYRSGKSIWLLNQVVAHCRQKMLSGKQAIITVPSHRYKKLVEERLSAIVVGDHFNRTDQGEADGAGFGSSSSSSSDLPARAGLVGLKILPFYDLCHQMLRQAGCGFRLIPDSIRPAILVKAIEKVKASGRLTGLESIADFAGTHAFMLELIDELERAGFSPAEVISQLKKVAASDARYMELGRVYEAYWLELESLNVFDERKLAYKTREILNKLDPNLLNIGLVATDGFDRFNRLQLQVLSGIARQSERNIIAFDYVADEPNYSWKGKSIKEMKEAFGGALQQTVFHLDSGIKKAEVINFKTLDRLMEMEEIAREAKKCLVEGYAADEIIVVARSLSPYITAIRAAFDRAKINYFLDQPIELGSLPLVRYLRRLLQLPISDFGRQDVVRTIASPFFNRAYLGLSSAEIEEIHDQSLSSLTVKGASDWHWALKLGKLIERLSLKRNAQAIFAEKSLTEHVAFVEDLIDDLLILPNDEEFSDPLVSWEEHQALFEFRQVLANLVLEESLLVHAYGPQLQTYPAFFKRLEHVLERANFRRPKISKEAITVCSADLVPNRRYKVIIMAGLNEGEFPRRSDQAGFLSRDEVRKWLSYGIDIENPRHHQSFEPSLYESLVERASHKLCQSCPVYEMSGEELLPSFFLTRGDEAMARQITFRAPRVDALLAPTSAQEFGAGWLWLSGRRAMANEANLPLSVRQFLAGLELPFATVQARTEARRGPLGELNGKLNEQVGLGLISVKTPEMWSVSKLNDYGKCPFRFWVSHMLRIGPVEEPELGLDARLLGEVYHKALEFFYLDLQNKSLSILDTDHERIQSLFEQSIEQAIEWLEQSRKFRRTDFWQYEKKEISFRLKRFFVKEKERANKSNGEFVPTYFEKGFGFKDGDSAPALVLRSNGGEIRMHGRVDRIDVARDGRVKVIDYKSGSAAISKRETVAGRNMQLPVYAMAVQQAILGNANVQVKSGQFLSFSSGDQTGMLDFQDGEDYIGLTQNYIGEFVGAIKNGDFSVSPSSPDSCKHCDHKQLCRITELGGD